MVYCLDGFMLLTSEKKTEDDWCGGHQNDAQHDHFKMFLEVESIMVEKEVVEEVPSKKHGDCPCHTSDHIE